MDDEIIDDACEASGAFEVDLDYEFDAPCFFDFNYKEPCVEAHKAELWFHTAESYPPSPFAKKLPSREYTMMKSINVSPKFNDSSDRGLHYSDPEVDSCMESYSMDVAKRDRSKLDTVIDVSLDQGYQARTKNQEEHPSAGVVSCDHTGRDDPKTKVHPFLEPHVPRKSTLMKPTASFLAKSITFPSVGNARFHSSKNNTYLSNSSQSDIQAIKRRKVDGGHLQKFDQMKHQTDFVHKVPRKETNCMGSTFTAAKLKLTIPRAPDLETARRAQRIKSKQDSETEHVKTFNARPLNKNILEPRSMVSAKGSNIHRPQMQISPATNLNDISNPLSGMRETKGEQCGVALEQDGQGLAIKSYAFSSVKEISCSRRNNSVHGNLKSHSGVPKHYNFKHKKVHHDPPTELFHKLSLSDAKQTTQTHVKLQF